MNEESVVETFIDMQAQAEEALVIYYSYFGFFNAL